MSHIWTFHLLLKSIWSVKVQIQRNNPIACMRRKWFPYENHKWKIPFILVAEKWRLKNPNSSAMLTTCLCLLWKLTCFVCCDKKNTWTGCLDTSKKWWKYSFVIFSPRLYEFLILSNKTNIENIDHGQANLIIKFCGMYETWIHISSEKSVHDHAKRSQKQLILRANKLVWTPTGYFHFGCNFKISDMPFFVFKLFYVTHRSWSSMISRGFSNFILKKMVHGKNWLKFY